MNYNTSIDGSHITAGKLDPKKYPDLVVTSNPNYVTHYWNDTPVRLPVQYDTFTNEDTVEAIKHAINAVYGITTYEKTPRIRKVIFNPPATVVMWEDGTKTIVKCREGEEFKEELGLAMAIAKRYFGNRSKFKKEVAKASRPQEKMLDNEEDCDAWLPKLIKKTFPISKGVDDE